MHVVALSIELLEFLLSGFRIPHVAELMRHAVILIPTLKIGIHHHAACERFDDHRHTHRHRVHSFLHFVLRPLGTAFSGRHRCPLTGKQGPAGTHARTRRRAVDCGLLVP